MNYHLKLFLLALVTLAVFKTPAYSSPINPIRQKWTYIRIVDYDSIWGQQGNPDLSTVTNHLPPATAPGVNFVLFGDSYGNNGSVVAYMLPTQKAGQQPTRVIKKIPEVAMDQAQTYFKFFDWVVANFPAEHYVLSYWGHGGGNLIPAGILGYDSASGDRGLSADQFGSAIKYLAAKTGKKVPVVFLCTCLNGTLENAYALKDSAEFFVAGETSVGCSLEPFNILLKNQNLSSQQLADATVKDYDGSEQPVDVVYSSVRLSAIDGLVNQVKRLAYALATYANKGEENKKQILAAAAKADDMGSFIPQPSLFSTYLDLFGLAEALSALPDASVREGAIGVQNSIQTQAVTSVAVHHPVGTNAHSHGISIVHPSSKFSAIKLDYYRTHEFNKQSRWGDYLQILIPGKAFGGTLPRRAMAPTATKKAVNPWLR